MALRFSRRSERGHYLVEADVGTPMTPEALDEIDTAIVEDAGTTAGLRILYDMSQVDSGALTLQDMEEIARQDNVRWRDGRDTRMAICVGSKVMFGRVRQYQIVSEPGRAYTVGVFEEKETAENWLRSAAVPDA